MISCGVSEEKHIQAKQLVYQLTYPDDKLYRKEGMLRFYHEGGAFKKSLVFVSIPFKVVLGTVASQIAMAACCVAFPFMTFKDSKYLPVFISCFFNTAFIGGYIALSVYVLPLSVAIALPATVVGLRIIGEWVKLIFGPEYLGNYSVLKTLLPAEHREELDKITGPTHFYNNKKFGILETN